MRASLLAQMVKNTCSEGDLVQSLGWEDPLEESRATHCSILAWRIPWTEESGGPQSMGSQRIRHAWVTKLSIQEWSQLPSGIPPCVLTSSPPPHPRPEALSKDASYLPTFQIPPGAATSRPKHRWLLFSGSSRRKRMRRKLKSVPDFLKQDFISVF